MTSYCHKGDFEKAKKFKQDQEIKNCRRENVWNTQ